MSNLDEHEGECMSKVSIKQWFSLWLLILCCALSAPSFSRVEIFRPFNDFVFGTWNGQGNINMSQPGCIRSYTGNFFNLRARNFAIRAQMNSPAASSASPYVFYNVADNNFSFPFALEATDLLAGGTQTLTPDIFSSAFIYELFVCFFGGNSVELNLSALASDLYTVPAGNYRVSMDIEARRLNNGGGVTGDRDRQNNLLGTITIPSLVRLSNIDDINFGIYDSVSATVNQNESFCIYSNAADYTLTPSAAITAGTANSFGLSSVNGDVLQYTVRINNSADASTGESLTNGQTSSPMNSNLSYPFSINCNGSDNAAVFVEINGADIQAVTPGDYSGTLVLQVAPL